MRYIVFVVGFAAVSVTLWDAFEVIISPRRVTRRFRLAKLFYRSIWSLWAAIARQIRGADRRESFLAVFGPLSAVVLFGVWAAAIIAGFALMHWGVATPLNVAPAAPLRAYLYLSGTTFFTLGLGDVTPASAAGRELVVIEAGLGFAFLAAIISYLPAISSTAYNSREVSISLLDARAGSPPTAGELLRRHGSDMKELQQLLYDWERWSAELLETHLSYPVLAYFRSQHTSQSWLAALTAILDTCALIKAGMIKDCPMRQAQMTFAMARHAVADLAQIFVRSRKPAAAPDRLPPESLAALRALLREAGVAFEADASAEKRLEEFRQMYEPHLQRLSAYLLMDLPHWFPRTKTRDTWQVTAWERYP